MSEKLSQKPKEQVVVDISPGEICKLTNFELKAIALSNSIRELRKQWFKTGEKVTLSQKIFLSDSNNIHHTTLLYRESILKRNNIKITEKKAKIGFNNYVRYTTFTPNISLEEWQQQKQVLMVGGLDTKAWAYVKEIQNLVDWGYEVLFVNPTKWIKQANTLKNSKHSNPLQNEFFHSKVSEIEHILKWEEITTIKSIWAHSQWVIVTLDLIAKTPETYKNVNVMLIAPPINIPHFLLQKVPSLVTNASLSKTLEKWDIDSCQRIFLDLKNQYHKKWPSNLITKYGFSSINISISSKRIEHLIKKIQNLNKESELNIKLKFLLPTNDRMFPRKWVEKFLRALSTTIESYKCSTGHNAPIYLCQDGTNKTLDFFNQK